MMATGPAVMATSVDGFHATAAGQRADELVRALFDAVNSDDHASIDALVARSFLSYDIHGTRSRTGFKRYVTDLRHSFSGLRFEVHENIGVLVEGDLVALRTIITGTHSGDYAGVPPTGTQIQTSASHIFRFRDDQLVEHWPVVDTYRILVAIGAIPPAASAFQQILGVEESPGGLFRERRGTGFGTTESRPVTREESRSVVRRLYDSVISTGREDDVSVVSESYIQNSGWTPDCRAAFASAIAISRGAMPDGRALQTHMVAESNRLASRSVWDGTITARPSGRLHDSRLLPHRRRAHRRALGVGRLGPGLPVLRASP
jgi:predicted ester cyclase